MTPRLPRRVASGRFLLASGTPHISLPGVGLLGQERGGVALLPEGGLRMEETIGEEGDSARGGNSKRNLDRRVWPIAD